METKEKIKKRIPKKVLIGAALVIAVLLVAVVIGFVLVRKDGTKTLKSEGNKLELSNVTEGMTLKNGDAVNGKFTPQEGATLYYIVSGADKRALGAGNIAVDKDAPDFSRNLTFDAKDHKGKDGQLYIYMQDDKGKLIDGVTVKVKFE